MLAIDGYFLNYYEQRNKIAITLPQTWQTLTSTMERPVERRTKVDDSEFLVILLAVINLFERKEAADG